MKAMLELKFQQAEIERTRVFMHKSAVVEPDQESASAMNRSRMLAREKLDVYFLARLNPQNIDKIIKLSGLCNYKKAVDTERPIIMFTAHYSRLIMPAIAMGLSGYETSALLAPVAGTKTEQWFLKKKISAMQAIMKGEMISSHQSLRSLYQLLNQKKTLIILIDVAPAPGQACYEINFLGGYARFPKGIIKLAKKTDALLLPYYACEQRGGLEAEIQPAFDSRDLDGEQLLQKISGSLEQQIIKRPDQWWVWPWLPALWSREKKNA